MSDKSDGDNYVTRAECALISGRIFEELSKYGRALYGDDGRGGMQADITKMGSALASIEKSFKKKENVITTSNELSTRRLIAYVAATAGIVGPVVTLLVQFILEHIGSS